MHLLVDVTDDDESFCYIDIIGYCLIIRGRRFAADDEVKEAVHDWLRSQPQTFFSSGIKKLTDRWAKCIEKKGDDIEK